MIHRLPEKRPAERVTVSFRFGRQLGGATLLPTPTVAAAVRKGADADPGAVLASAPVVVGADVLVQVAGGLDGVEYLLTCTVDTSAGDRFVLEGLLPVALPR